MLVTKKQLAKFNQYITIQTEQNLKEDYCKYLASQMLNHGDAIDFESWFEKELKAARKREAQSLKVILQLLFNPFR